MLDKFGGKNGGGSSGQVQGRGHQKRGLQKQRLPAGMVACTKKQKIQDEIVERRLLGKNIRFVPRIQLAASTKHEGMKRQRRMKVMKDMTKKIRSGGRMDSEIRWWVAELLAADCEKAWLHPGEEETTQKLYAWLEKMKKEDEKRKMDETLHQIVNQMIKCAEGSAVHLHKITKHADLQERRECKA